MVVVTNISYAYYLQPSYKIECSACGGRSVCFTTVCSTESFFGHSREDISWVCSNIAAHYSQTKCIMLKKLDQVVLSMSDPYTGPSWPGWPLTNTAHYWAVLGCTGRYWVVLVCTGLYWAVLGYTGKYLATLGCTELYWAGLGCTRRYWAVLGGTGLYWAQLGWIGLDWAVLSCTWLYRAIVAVLGCTGLYWAALGCTRLYRAVLGYTGRY